MGNFTWTMEVLTEFFDKRIDYYSYTEEELLDIVDKIEAEINTNNNSDLSKELDELRDYIVFRFDETLEE